MSEGEQPAAVGGLTDFEVEEWDADFLDQLVQAEELALSTQHPRHAPSLLLSPTFLTHPAAPRVPPCDVSYSPPRELSQRTREIIQAEDVPDSTGSFCAIANHFAKEQENDRLKKQLQGVSKQLHQPEQEILELRKEKDKKEDELKILQSKVEAKDAEFQTMKNAEIPTAPGISTSVKMQSRQMISLALQVYVAQKSYLTCGTQMIRNREKL
ncbi:protein dimerizations [Striga hermonthica]|uniref:Protein dimerizations n=1 Tax=Striga hermonthica TaxID=68872 RepID=A0A9N7R753_STRHE|nr:protein dimerizations [Striga hermonthica]